MPLKIEKRKSSGIWRIRGTVYGVRIDQSARTRSRIEAKKEAKRLEAQITREHFSDAKPKGHTFADAAIRYLESGRGGAYELEPVIVALGETLLADITQGTVDKKALTRWPDAKVSTRLRLFYAPVSAILTFAQGERMMEAFRLRFPKPEATELDYRTPDEAERIIDAMGPLGPMATFLFGTGCRISEACELQWKDISPDGHRVTLWVTKSVTRSFPLCARTRAALPERRERDDFVWLNSKGKPWAKSGNPAGYSGPRHAMLKACKRAEITPTTPHTARHSWASWHYADNLDTILLMQEGGWASLDLVQRYTHLGSPDLKAQVEAFGWRDFGQYVGNSKVETAR